MTCRLFPGAGALRRSLASALLGFVAAGCQIDDRATTARGAAAPSTPSAMLPPSDGATPENVSGTGGSSGSGAATSSETQEAPLAPGGIPGSSGNASQPNDAAAPEVAGEPAVHFVGRMDLADPVGPRFAWSGSGVVAEFTGSSVKLRLDDPGTNQFTVVLDGEVAPTLVTVAGPSDYELASGLPSGAHRVEVYRRTEASFGPTQFIGFDFGADGALLPPPAVNRRIEIIGDSVSAGYGNEGTLPCSFTADTENHYLTYGAIAARALGAELSTVAWSGKGVVYNYDADLVDPMPALYGRVLPADPASAYDFSTLPDVVLINLGTNDFSTDGDPATELFAAEYTALLERVRAAYPDAFILCTVGPLLSGADLDAARAGIAAGVAGFEAAGGSNARAWDMNVPNGNPPGCDYHPNLATHQAMADAVSAELSTFFE